MTLRPASLFAGTAGLAALAAATLAFAAPGDNAAPPEARHAAYAPGPMGHGDPAAMAQAHLARLKNELKITPAQEPAWQAFTGKLTEQAQAARARHEQFMKSAPVVSAPDRMAQHIEQMKQRLADMQAMQTALKDLYGQLGTEQRNILDHLGPMAWHGGPHGEGMHPGMHPGMGAGPHG
jgi:periplasmic protein CpxP/Spy